MRSLCTGLAGLFLTSASLAQTVDSSCINCCIEWDGSSENCWKVSAPSGPSDAMSVDLDNRCHNLQIVAICAQFCDTSGTGVDEPILLAIACDNLALDPTGTTPDLSGAGIVTGVVNPNGQNGTFCTEIVAYDVPDVCLTSSKNTHVVMKFRPGDSSLWLCADSAGPIFGHSYFTTDCYSTPAIPFTLNWVLGPGVIPKPVKFWVNGSTTTTITEGSGTLALLFVGNCTFQPFMLFLSNCSGGLIVPAINLVFFTGLNPVDDAGKTACLVATWPCNVFVGTLCFAALYRDCPPSKKILISNEIKVTINASPACGGKCFGWEDDGALDSTIWKVQNPAGSGDYFNVHMGTAPAAVNTITQVEVASWNFCGAPAPWDEVGIYDSNLALDATGGTPALPALAAVNGQLVPAAQSDWSYPATVYNTADYVVGAEDFHGAVKWPTGDSCVWIGSDTDSADAFNPCFDPAAVKSYFTLDGYNTPAIIFSAANWMIRLDWK